MKDYIYQLPDSSAAEGNYERRKFLILPFVVDSYLSNKVVHMRLIGFTHCCCNVTVDAVFLHASLNSHNKGDWTCSRSRRHFTARPSAVLKDWRGVGV